MVVSIAQSPKDGKSVHRGEIHIEDDQVAGMMQRTFQSFGSIAAHLAGVTNPRQGPAYMASEERFIFDDQNAHKTEGTQVCVTGRWQEAQPRTTQHELTNFRPGVAERGMACRAAAGRSLPTHTRADGLPQVRRQRSRLEPGSR